MINFVKKGKNTAGVFVQENTPIKTTNEAFWLKEEIQTNIKINLDSLPDNVLNLSTTYNGITKTVRDVINTMTTEQKNIYNSYNYHGILVRRYTFWSSTRYSFICYVN